ncbi:RHS repeat-associated core domain-containing protein [Stenotrophomonas oahuensis]|uniref:DUF6531 domain-containing protein n=1 Tax=Stenotrophomonas oahuensis TaxID=3003271 RepID=A0ABY9YQP9_9GAMM|nr:RHS repeat-associated core domain-containing protein [Stenotrophomonas sp. A5586]WNH53222.1 DUF6531 domain-containing protein [Stenotrophomonas sp. A5586]
MKATDTSQCSPVWTVYHWKVRTVECPAYMGWNGAECAAQGIANIWSSTIPCDQCDLRGNPVSVVSGSKVQRENDFSLGWLDFYRTLNSSYQTQGGIGRYWTHNLSMRLYGAGTAYAVVAYPSGSLMSFSGDEAVDGSGATLRSAGGGEYDLYLEDGRYRFNVSGRLSRIERYAGDTLSIEFDGKLRISRVVHSSGRIVEFGYDGTSAIGESELAYIKDLDGPLVTYAYDDEFRIRSATYRDGTSRRYLYEHPKYRFALTGIEDETGNRYATYAYNADGLAVSSEHAGSAQKATFSYLADGSTTYINALGSVEKVTFTAAQPYRKIASITTEAGTESWTYAPRTGTGSDFRRRVQSHTSRSGSVDTYTYQTLADPVYGTVSIKRKAEASNRPETRTTEVWKQRDINQMVKQVSPSRTVTWLRNPRGQITQETTQTPAGESRTTTQTYCEAVNAQAGCPVLGLLLSTDGPMHGTDDTVRYTYYPEDAPGCATSDAACTYRKGDLWKTIQPLGHVTEVLAYDGAGRPHMVMDANGVVTEYQYTPRGWMATATVRGTDDASGTYDRVTTMEYLPTGQLSKATAPDGTVVTYTYDAAQRLTAIGDGAGNRIEYTLDAAGNRVQEEYKGAGGEVKRTLSRVYNRLSQLVTSADGLANPTDFTYDAEGNVNSVVDALGRVSRREHDAFGRLTRQVDDEGGIAATVAMAYDSDDNQTQVIDPKQLPTTYAYNGFGDLLQQVSPDTGTTTFTVDAAGNRTTRTDARGVTATYQYDVLGRVTHIRYPDPTLDVAYTYDIAPAVCAANEQFSRGRVGTVIHAGGSTQYCRDRFGQLTRKVQTVNGVATTVRYGYTAGGRLATLTYPDGTVADYLRDSLGRISEVGVTRSGQARQVVVTNVTYAPFGPATGWTYGNGRTLQRPVDQDYRTIAVHDPAPGGLSVGYGYDAVGGITELTNGDGTEVLAQYSYDALGRLTQTKDGATGTPIETYEYDDTGNRTALTTNAGTEVYTYAPGSHRLTEVAGNPRSYDAAGNTLEVGTKSLEYGDSNRLGVVKIGGVVAEAYGYNDRGERVRRVSEEGDAQYSVYDEAGQWLGNYSSTGRVWQQAVWLDQYPVAILPAQDGHQAQLTFIQVDHLGTPRVAIDSARDVSVWAWSSKGEAFGDQAPSADTDGDGVEYQLNLRFPGQQYTAATELNYNYLRDYDPAVGRYIQSDPIGLAGGLSTYLYSGASPVESIDPLGLRDVDLGSGYKGRVDLYNKSNGVGFEIHVYDRRGNEVGVYGPNGWFNKHGKKAADVRVPAGVEAQCEVVATDYRRRIGDSLSPAMKRSMKMKKLLGWLPFWGPVIDTATTPSDRRVCDPMPNYPGCESL